MDYAQQIVQAPLREGNGFVHRVEVVRVHSGNQLTDQVKALCVGKGDALVPFDLLGFVAIVVGLAAKRNNLKNTRTKENQNDKSLEV